MKGITTQRLLPSIKRSLDELYAFYNNREAIHPDPLEFLHPYQDIRDREIVGLIASSLAYGRVVQILKSVSTVLQRMNPSPFSYLLDTSQKRLLSTFGDFKHRFTTGEELARMLWGARRIIERYGSLYHCFVTCMDEEDDTILPALNALVTEFYRYIPEKDNSLLPRPSRGSACKRLNLFLRWMVRKDEVDPGGWDGVPAVKLIVPLDTHMHKISLRLGLTRRKQADMRTAMEITQAFRRLAPEDPIRYDFALTRLGIRGNGNPKEFIKNVTRSTQALQRSDP